MKIITLVCINEVFLKFWLYFRSFITIKKLICNNSRKIELMNFHDFWWILCYKMHGITVWVACLSVICQGTPQVQHSKLLLCHLKIRTDSESLLLLELCNKEQSCIVTEVMEAHFFAQESRSTHRIWISFHRNWFVQGLFHLRSWGGRNGKIIKNATWCWCEPTCLSLNYYQVKSRSPKLLWK